MAGERDGQGREAPDERRRQILKGLGALGAGLVVGDGLLGGSGALGAEGGQTGRSSRGDEVPRRQLGRTGVTVSALGLGGFHLGVPRSDDEATRIVHEAVAAGVTFFDNAWEYHEGKSEKRLGQALKGRRDKVFLMTKVCTHGRGARVAMQQLEESLRRLQTDHLDLWQIHEVIYDNDPDLDFMKGGAIEALDQARRQGKARFVGFTGHKDPAIHLKMLSHDYPFDTVQMPLNCFDASFRSFEKRVLPELQRRGIAPLGMKPLQGHGDAVKKKVVTAAESLRYAMSLPVATTITGIDSLDVLHQDLGIARGFTPMSASEMDALRQRCAGPAADGRFELYKMSLKFDNPQAREAHGFPVDPQQMEIKEELDEATGKAPPW